MRASFPSRLPLLLATLTAVAATARAQTDPGVVPVDGTGAVLNLGFEDGSYRHWTVEGDTWGDEPVRGDTVAERRGDDQSAHVGDYWVGGYESARSDAGTGTLTSVAFPVTHRWASFLVGGGASDDTAVELLDAATDEVVFRASGHDQETLQRVVVDLDGQRRAGAQLRIRLVDRSTSGWGHVNFDDFRFHDDQPQVRPSRLVTSPVLKHLVPNPDDARGTAADGIWVPPGFRVDRIAEAAGVTQPIAFTIDARGRLWIVEAHSYPERRREGEGLDRIVILADRDGDGEFETRTLFQDGLNLVSGIEVGHGGVWIGAAPQLLFIPDRDGDDRPDREPEVLIDGFGYQDTHETLNSFAWGPDGWLYGVQGVFVNSLLGKPGTAGEDRIEMHAGIWRYHPVQRRFDVFAHGGSNQWGLDYDDYGRWFMTHCRSYWGGGPTTLVVRNGHYWNQANSGFAPFVSKGRSNSPDTEEALRNCLPSSARYGHGRGGAGGSRSVYGGHSHVGTMIYLGDNWPAEYRNQLFTFNLHGHQVNRQINRDTGSACETVHSGADQLFVADPEFIGIDLQYGPDGAVYFIDWQDRSHCHSPETERWDRSNGRVYRMAWQETFAPRPVDLAAMNDDELVELQNHRNDWFVRTARRLLCERHVAGRLDDRAVTRLRRRLEDADSTALRLRALWALHVVDGLAADDYAGLAQHSDPHVRAQVIGLCTDRPDALAAVAAVLPRLAASEPDAPVRLAMASILPQLPDAPRWQTAEALGARGEDRDDRFVPNMIWFGLAELTPADPPRAARLAETTPLPLLADSIQWFLSRTAAGRDALVQGWLRDADRSPSRGLEMMAWGLQNADVVAAPSDWPRLLAALEQTDRADLGPIVAELNVAFGDPRALAAVRAVVADGDASADERHRAIELLQRTGDDQCATQLLAALDDDGLRSDVVPMMGRFDDDAVAEALISRLADFDGGDRAAALAALSRQPKLAAALLTAVRQQRVDRAWVTSMHVREMQSLADPAVAELIAADWDVQDNSEAVQQTMARFRKLYSEAPVWAYRGSNGHAVYQRVCAACHTHGDSGGQIGPDLTGSWRNGLDYFLESTLDPNAVVGEAFRLHIVTKRDGSIVTGRLTEESPDGLVLEVLGDTIRVRRSDIDSHQRLEQSLMPAGLLESLPEREAIELLKYLLSEG